MKHKKEGNPSPTSPWPYSIIATFVVFISALAAYVTFACSNDVELVAADYYQQEIEYEQQMNRIKRTQALGDQVKVVLQPDSKSLRLRLPEAHASQPDLDGSVQLYYPADGNKDLHFPLELASTGIQEFDFSSLDRGLWRMKVRWTKGGEEYHFEQDFRSHETALVLH